MKKITEWPHFKTAIVLFFYSLLVLLFTYPLVANLKSSIPGGEGDAFVYLWNNWWLKHSLENLSNPYFTEMLAYPFKSNLALHSLTLINGLMALPLGLVLPPVLTFNLVFLSTLVLAAYGAYSLLHYLFKNFYAALLGGMIFVFNSYIYQKMTGHFNYTTIWPMPFFLLFFIKIFKEDKYRNAVVAALMLTASFYNDFYYTIGLIVFGALIAFWTLVKNKTLFIGKLRQLAVFLAVWLTLCSPLLYLTIKTSLARTHPEPQLSQINLYSPDIRSFLIPSAEQSVYGDNFINYYQSLRYHDSVVYLSFSLMLLAIVGYFFGKKKDWLNNSRFWLLSAVIFLFLTLGPFLFLDGYIYKLGGELFTIPLPYILFYLLPFVKGIMVPPRFIIFVILSLLPLACFVLVELFNRLPSRALKLSLTALVAGIFLFENFTLPIRVSSARVPDYYYALGREKSDRTILELPYALSNSFYTLGQIGVSSKIEFYQTVHGRKILNGWISRVPDDYYAFFSRLAGLDYLINPAKELSDEEAAVQKDRAAANFSKLKIGHIIVHPEYYNHRELRNTLDYLNRIYGKPALKDNMLVYELK